MWYGLKIDGEIVMVKWFTDYPTVTDFNYPYIDEFPGHYEVVMVEVREKFT